MFLIFIFFPYFLDVSFLCSPVAASHRMTAISLMLAQPTGLPQQPHTPIQIATCGAMIQVFCASTANHARLGCWITSSMIGRRWLWSTLYSLSSSLLFTRLDAVLSGTTGRTISCGRDHEHSGHGILLIQNLCSSVPMHSQMQLGVDWGPGIEILGIEEPRNVNVLQ